MTRARTLLAVVALTAVFLVPAAPAGASSSSNMVAKVNEYRANRGLPALLSSGSLNHSAAKYARHMMKAHYFGHAGRIRASRRFKTLGEILEMHDGSQKRVSAALKAWGDSPGHRAIILDHRFKYVGAGVVSGRFQGHVMTFWVMHFGR